MRKFLLASVATLGTGGLMAGRRSLRRRQRRLVPPTQGQAAYQLGNPTAYVNNNNNYQAPALPGPLANPTRGRSSSTSMAKWRPRSKVYGSSVDTSPPVAPTGNSFKVNPYRSTPTRGSTSAPQSRIEARKFWTPPELWILVAASGLTRRQSWPQYIGAVGSIGSDSEPTAIMFASQHIPPIRRKQ